MTERVRTTIIAGLFTLIGGVIGGCITGYSQIRLAKQKFNSDLALKEQKFNSDLVFKALESPTSDGRLDALNLLTQTNLIKDDSIKAGVKRYTKSIEKDTTKTVPQFSTPIHSNSRIYLLGGTDSKKKLFSGYENELLNAGFNVLGSKIIIDNERPNGLEVRYFHTGDQKQAQQIGEVVKFKSSVPDVPVKLYLDENVGPGYIEIWFGR